MDELGINTDIKNISFEFTKKSTSLLYAPVLVRDVIGQKSFTALTFQLTSTAGVLFMGEIREDEKYYVIMFNK